MPEYYLTFSKGTITEKDTPRGIIYSGSHTQALWSPYNPRSVGGWQDGDKLQVHIQFILNPNVPHPPPASNYMGLVVAALYNPTQTQIDSKKYHILHTWSGGTLAGGISQESHEPEPGSGIYFYNAQAKTLTQQLTPPSRGTLTNLVYQWEMTYFADPTLQDQGMLMEFIFGYGDPMDDEVLT